MKINMIGLASDHAGYELKEYVKKYLDKSDKEDLNTYYVALSRARNKITNVGYR